MPADPRVLYIILVLPGLFGVTLLAEGIHKLLQGEWYGWISLLFGFLFLGVVAAVYFVFTSHLNS